MNTIETEQFRRALHLSRLIPLGHKHSPEKKAAVKRWCDAIKKALANSGN